MILSQCAFAFGACGGLLMTRRPASAKTASKASVNWPPRSRIRNFSFVASVSMRKLRAALRVPINHPARSSRMSILSQNAAESITSMDVERRDPGSGSVRGGKRSERSCLVESPMRPVFVIEGFELAQRVQKVVLVPDQRSVQQFAPAGLDPALHDRIHARYPDSALNDADSSIDQHGIEGRGEFGVSVPYQEPGGAAVYRFKIHRIGLELGVLWTGYAARWYSLISPSSILRRSIRPSSDTTVRSS